ncbi:hypothetical protein FM110_08055 [Brachybacterium nesterenkovii]|uniref:Uncharacterized protein n=1 Tax=Brachybacterium nesterenkovii TaxID=47847 RepID=A0A1X6X153_9MICO|nr:hypothetical protein FM110_08055 [Brachybacterium nesterenkovii]
MRAALLMTTGIDRADPAECYPALGRWSGHGEFSPLRSGRTRSTILPSPTNHDRGFHRDVLGRRHAAAP